MAIQKAANVKLVIQPVIGIMVHEYVFEGPCRFGAGETLTLEFDRMVGADGYKAFRDNLAKYIQPEPDFEMLENIADFFNVDLMDLVRPQLDEDKAKAPTLTPKDERDIARDLERIMDELDAGGALMFDGDPMSDEARESIRAAMKLGLEAAKVKNKERFTPKRYRKE